MELISCAIGVAFVISILVLIICVGMDVEKKCRECTQESEQIEQKRLKDMETHNEHMRIYYEMMERKNKYNRLMVKAEWAKAFAKDDAAFKKACDDEYAAQLEYLKQLNASIRGCRQPNEEEEHGC